jgi:hypothetical protein
VLLVDLVEVDLDDIIEADFMHAAPKDHHLDLALADSQVGTGVVSSLRDLPPVLSSSWIALLIFDSGFAIHHHDGVRQDLKSGCHNDAFDLIRSFVDLF